MIETVLSRYPTPPCATLLGLDILEASKPDGTIRIRFEAKPEFCNASGHVQGGILSAMLDDTMGPAVLIATDAARLPVTITMTVTFLAPAKPGVIYGRGFVRKLGKSIGYLEARLEDENEAVLAQASSSVRLVRFDDRTD